MKTLIQSLAFVLMMGLSSGIHAKPWKGAELLTWQTFQYGAFETRLRAAAGSGIITPFFLIKDDSWVAGQEWQELDFEIFGRSGGTRFQTQIMTPGSNGKRVEHIKEFDAKVVLSEDYHTYRLEWAPQYLRFYFDGYLIREETDRKEFAKFFDTNRVEPMRLRAGVWGGDTSWTGVFDPLAVPTHAFLRYIAYERYTPGQGPKGSDFTRDWTEYFTSYDSSKWYSANWDFDYAICEYSPNNVAMVKNNLVLSFTSESQQGYQGEVPVDRLTPPGPPPVLVTTPAR